ncbi:MAG: transposase [Hyphomicrobiaceae bacterium]|nr:MAG: transposase [Hyphomicrobiaceae bacterium]
MARDKDDPWRNFPKTAVERRLATEEDCGAYWIAARWGGRPACARCGSERGWPERGGFLFECAECDHQTSLTPGTVPEKTRTPFKMWFCAIFEISSRERHLGEGIAAHHGVRVHGVELAAQAPRSDGPARALTAR